MTYASVDDVARTLGRLISDPIEQDQVNQWITDTEQIIRERLGDLARLNADTLKAVIKEVVARRVLNPEGKSNERIDDYSYGFVDDAKRVGLHVTDEEWSRLAPVVPVSAGQVQLGGMPGYGCSTRGWWM